MAERKITSSGKAYLDKTSEIFSETFKNDPVIRYLTSSLALEEHYAYMPSYMHTLLKAASLNHGIFQEIDNWSCCAVWMLPGTSVDNLFTIIQAGFFGCLFKLGIGGIKRMLSDVSSQSNQCKARHLKKQDHYSLFFIGTKTECRGRGLAKEVIRRFQLQAAESGLPIWLEATTSNSRDIYASCGFTTLDVLTFGKGSHDENGEFQKNGPGVSSWAMIWYPGKESSSSTAPSR